jgi:hypothetical protein
VTDEEYMLTSDISRRLDHKSAAVTRDWIRKRGLVAKDRDTETGEKKYRRTDVEKAIAAMPRGTYLKARPPVEGQHDDDNTTAEP